MKAAHQRSRDGPVRPWRPVVLGGLRVERPLALAPMAGYTDAALRSLCGRFGCGLALTEVATAAGLVHGSRRTLHLLETMPGEPPRGAHIYGAEPEVMAEAAALIDQLGRFQFIDVNAGCPVRKIVAKRAGVALMEDPGRLARIVRAMADACSLPVTVKTRLGLAPERSCIAEVGQAVEEAGAGALFVHARFASQKHSGPADWEALARVKAGRGIPVFGNGGVKTAADALAMLRRTGVDGVMIGRAAVGAPWLFGEIERLASGRPPRSWTAARRRAVIAEQLRRAERLQRRAAALRRKSGLTPPQAAARLFRGHLVQYLAGAPGWPAVRRRLNELRTPEDVLAAVDQALTGA